MAENNLGAPAPESQTNGPVAGQEIPASESNATAALEEGVGTQPTEEETPEAPPKTFTQEDLDKEIGKRLAKAERKAKREMDARIAEILAQQKPPVQSQTPADDRPTQAQFLKNGEVDADAYIEAVSEWKAKQVLKWQQQEFETRSQSEAAQRHADSLRADYQERCDAASEKYDDFDEVTGNPALKIAPAMADAILSSDVGPDVAYYLGINPKEAERIAKLPPFLQIKEIGRLEAKVITDPPARKTSSAPPPITPVKPKGGSPARSSLDPKFLQEHGIDAWMKAEEARMRKAAGG